MVTTPLTTEERITTLKLRYHIPQAQALMLELLLTNKLCTMQDLIDGGVAIKEGSVRVVKLRLKDFLLANNIALNSRQKVGYWLSPEAKQIIEKEIHNFNYPDR